MLVCKQDTQAYRIGITNSNKIHAGGEADVTNREERYRIPQDLLRHLFFKHIRIMNERRHIAHAYNTYIWCPHACTWYVDTTDDATYVGVFGC